MTHLEALRAVYVKGERCRECPHRYVKEEADRLAGSRVWYTTWRYCDVIESQESKLPREAWDCPGVDELGKKPCESE